MDNNAKRYKARRYYLPKGVIKNYNVIINGKNFYEQPSDSDIKQYEEIRKQQGKMKIILQDVCWIMITKTHCRLIAVHLSRQKELDPDPKEI